VKGLGFPPEDSCIVGDEVFLNGITRCQGDGVNSYHLLHTFYIPHTVLNFFKE
jgi:hypothetical protein